MHTTYTNPRISNLKLKSRSSPSSPGNHKSHRNARLIQNQLDSLRARERSSLSRNSSLISDISRLKQQVTHMNVSFNKLELARDSYDRYVQDCMVTWIQKEFRESETNNPVSSRNKPESEHAASAVHVTPTKTIGIQTTEEHLSVQVSDWSISPETQSQLIPHLHSTMMVPNVSSKPPRDTSQRQTTLPSQTQTETSLLPPMINFSDLRTPNVPPDATLFSYDQSNFSAYPSGGISALPESPVPSGLPPHLPRQPMPSNSTPTLISAENFNSAFHSIPNVSMIQSQEGVVHSQHSYGLPQQPVYVDVPNYPLAQTQRPTLRHMAPHARLPTATMQPPNCIQGQTTLPQIGAVQYHPSIPLSPSSFLGQNIPPPNATFRTPNPLVQTTMPPTATFQPPNCSQGQTTLPQNGTLLCHSSTLLPQTRFPVQSIHPQNSMFQPIQQENSELPPTATIYPPPIPQVQATLPQNETHETSQGPVLPQSATFQLPISTQRLDHFPMNESISTEISQEMPLGATFTPPVMPQIQTQVDTVQPPIRFQEEIILSGRPPMPLQDTTQMPKIEQSTPTTQPLHTSDIRTLSPNSGESGRHQVAQPLRHIVSPPSNKPAPPPPIHSILSPSKPVSHHETQLSHSRQPSTLPTIPEPGHELFEMAATHEPPLAAINTSAQIARAPSAQDFPLQYPINLERRATLDLSQANGFELKFSLNPSVSISPTEDSTVLRHNSNSTPTHGNLTNGNVSEESSGSENGSHLQSSRNQFDLTAGEDSEEEVRRKESHIMVDTTATAKPRANVSVIRKIGTALNAYCLDTTVSGSVKMYDSIAPSDRMKGQIAESNVLTNRILSQAEAPGSNLASWDVQTLGAIFLSEISKYVNENGPILTNGMLSQTRVDLESFNRLLPINSQDLWRAINEHFASLIEGKMSADEIGVTFTPYLMKGSSSSEDIKKGTLILVTLLNEMFDLEGKRDSIMELTQDYSSDSESDYVPEDKGGAYQLLLKSMASRSVDKGVKGGIDEDIVSIPSSLVSEGSADVDLGLMLSPVDPKNSDQSPTQLLEEAVGEKIESSDSDSGEEPAGYVPDFGGNQSMSDREIKKKIEKFWGSDLDSESEGERVKPPKKKSSMDDFAFD